VHPPPSPPEQLDAVERVIDDWLAAQVVDNPAVAGVEREPNERRWFVRLVGEEKATFSARFELDQRTLRYESYLMPAPEENEEATFAHLLRRNLGLYGLALAIGPEDAVFLVGQLDVRQVDEDELDRVLGSLYAATEQFFRPAMRLGFASRFPG
jgi:hypothetical protein